jgi:hypothetical protein
LTQQKILHWSIVKLITYYHCCMTLIVIFWHFADMGVIRQGKKFNFCNLPPFWFSNRRHINERDVIFWDVFIAIISRNILRKFLGWHSLIRHACQFKLQNVQRIIYQDLSGNKFATVFLTISHISAGVHERLSSIFVFCDRIWIKQKATLKTWSNFKF